MLFNEFNSLDFERFFFSSVRIFSIIFDLVTARFVILKAYLIIMVVFVDCFLKLNFFINFSCIEKNHFQLFSIVCPLFSKKFFHLFLEFLLVVFSCFSYLLY